MLAQMFRDALGLTVAVETGTYMGEGAQALSSVFPRVWSIELSEELYSSAVGRLAAPGLNFIHGSSVEVLPNLMTDVGEPALFWLDGHYSGHGTAGVDLEVPLLDEIAAIDASAVGARSALLIDDARLFLGPPPPPHKPDHWPTFMVIADLLRSDHLRYVTLFEDMIIAVPPDARTIVERYYLLKSYPEVVPLSVKLPVDGPPPDACLVVGLGRPSKDIRSRRGRGPS